MFFPDAIEGKRILLHACCGPCSLGAIEPLLSDGCSLVLFYYNPCIIDGEFEKRLDALNTVAAHYGLDVVVPEHDYSSYLGYTKPYANDGEGGARCALCMRDRMAAAARYAHLNGFDAYSTTLTVSPHKNSRLIFSLAEEIERQGEAAPFLARDFKKKDGFLRSTRLSRELGIYRQNFCGCEFSRGAVEE